MSDREFLYWLAERLVNVYGESPNVDFIQRLRTIAYGYDSKFADITVGQVLRHVQKKRNRKA
jgi:hypothetical protein